jgi:hypothetical protein
MRKALIAVAVATALFAVGAFAATFALTSEDVASERDLVESCAESATVDFTTGAFDSTLGDFPVTGATVTFVAPAGGNADACNDSDASLSIRSGAGTWNNYGPEAVDAMEADFTIGDLPVEPINEVAVMVEGFTIPVAN